MHAFCIYCKGLPPSETLALRCLQSARAIRQPLELFPGILKHQAREVADREGIANAGYDDIERHQWRRLRDAQLACLLSHDALWKRCIELDRPITIVEHDVEFLERIPDRSFPGVLNLQSEIWDDAHWPWHHHVRQKLADPAGGYLCLPGSCAYAITPTAAETLRARLRKSGPLPADLFVNKRVVPIEELRPRILRVSNDYSTIDPRSNAWEEAQFESME